MDGVIRVVKLIVLRQNGIPTLRVGCRKNNNKKIHIYIQSD